MPNQTDSPECKPLKSDDRPSPDVGRDATDGQSNARGHGASDEQGQPPPGASPPTNGTWQAQGADSGRIDKAPGAGLSDHNGPSDPDARRGPEVDQTAPGRTPT